MNTCKIKSAHPESQGPFVLIEESDFNSEKHELWTPEVKEEKQLPVDPNAGKEPATVATDPAAVKPWVAPVKKK